MFGDGKELALVDVREELIFSPVCIIKFIQEGAHLILAAAGSQGDLASADERIRSHRTLDDRDISHRT